MFTKTIAAAAIAGGVALLAPQAADASPSFQSTSVTVPAGNRVCLDATRPADFSARAEGFANPGVKFTFLVRQPVSSTYTLLAESVNNAPSSPRRQTASRCRGPSPGTSGSAPATWARRPPRCR